MSTNDDFKAEVANGFLLIAIKIPSVECAACGKVYTPTVTAEQVENLFRRSLPLSHALTCSPWCDKPRWGFVQLEEADGYKRALVCADCYAPIAKIEADAEALKREANVKVGATVKVWGE